MPNEFIARNGIISRGSTSISGSFLVSGSTTIAGGLFLTGSGVSAPLILSDGNYIYGGGSVSGANTIFGVTANQTELYARNSRIGIWSPGGGSNYLYSVNGDFGIGTGITTPSARLHISGASSANLLRVDSPASSSILFVSGSGQVGIGTTSVSTNILTVGTSVAQVAYFNSIVYVPSTSYLVSKTIYSGTGRNILPNSLETPSIVVGTTTANAVGVLHVRGAGATSATTTFLLQNSTPANLMTVQDNGQITVAPPILALLNSQSAFLISQSISSSNVVGGQVYGVNITPTFWQTTASQTETALRVAATFTQSSVLATGGTNIIADFGATSVGSQLTVTDVTSGSIYMVNDVSGLPIIEATSDWTVNMYNFPSIVLQKTGSQVNINGTLRVSGSFILPLSQSTAPQTGSAYWSGSLLFIWDGTRYRSSSFA